MWIHKAYFFGSYLLPLSPPAQQHVFRQHTLTMLAFPTSSRLCTKVAFSMSMPPMKRAGSGGLQLCIKVILFLRV